MKQLGKLRNMRLRSKLLATYLGISIGVIVISGFFTLGMVQQALERNMNSELKNSTCSILHMVKTTASASIKNYLRAVAEKNLEIAEAKYKEYKDGKISRDEMADSIRSLLLSQVIGKTGYIFCINSQGIATVHPDVGVEGGNYAKLKFIQNQIRTKQGYMEYNWVNPGEENTSPKALYMSYFEPLDWIISVSIHREEFNQLINVEDFRCGISAFKFRETGYVYVVDVEGDIIIHPELEGTNLLQSPAGEADFFKEMLTRKKGGIHYWWQNPGESSAREKLVYFELMPEYKWIVASSAYYNEALQPFANLRTVIFFSIVCVVVVLLVSTFFISSHLLRPISGLIGKFKAGAEGDLSVRMESDATYEFNKLGTFFNRFMAHHQVAQRELAESEQKYKFLADNIHDVIWLASIDLTRILYMSPSIESVCGWSAEESKHLSLQDIFSPLSQEVFKEVLAKDLNGVSPTEPSREPAKMEVELSRKDGSMFWAEITISLLYNDEKEPSTILGVTRDITYHKDAEQQNEELQEQVNRMKKMEALGVLASGVAHDLNNVLSGVVSYPDLLLVKLPADSSLRKPIETIKDSGLKAANIVQDLLTLARRGVTTFEVLKVNDLVRDFLKSPELAKLKSFHQDIVFESDLEEKLPNIKGSALHLKKTVMNLVSNAAEAQPGGGHVLMKTYSCYLDNTFKGMQDVKEGDYVVMTVKDEGIGIAPEDLKRIFEPFYTKKVMGRSGTGLGMAVVWGTVKDHKAYIDVITEENSGTQFNLYFPMTRERFSSEKDGGAMGSYGGRGESILVVDDMKLQREIASELLTTLQYTVYSASSGEKAIEFLTSNRVDLVILDMIMEMGIDGLETYEAIRSIAPEQKVIIVSGFAETDRVKTAQRLGAGRYVKKPYTLEKIGLAVRQALDGNEQTSSS